MIIGYYRYQSHSLSPTHTFRNGRQLAIRVCTTFILFYFCLLFYVLIVLTYVVKYILVKEVHIFEKKAQKRKR
jgi:hypothetical protein